MADSEQRKFVSDLYQGKRWRRRVRRMNDEQVFAIWIKEKQKIEEEEKKKKDDKDIPF